MNTLPGLQRCILQILNNHEEVYGQELCRKSKGRLTTGNLYGVLYQMEKKGLVVSRLETDECIDELVAQGEFRRSKRRIYQITETGFDALLEIDL